MTWCIVIALLDNFLKPLLFGRGVEVSSLVIFVGAIGGMFAMGMIGLFLGSVRAGPGFRALRGMAVRAGGDERLGRPVVEMLRRCTNALIRARLLGGLLVLSACDGGGPPPGSSLSTEAKPATTTAAVDRRAEYITGASCVRCHPKEFAAWTGSHHDRAMQIATAESVLGDFDDASFEAKGGSWLFFRRENTFAVKTVGPDGSLADFDILYTFGVDPLQQYLVALPGGRLQALTVAWDTRPSELGGQRWFSVYPDEALEPGDVLHWTGIANRWNSMCADCHSTNLRKNFDLGGDRYDTQWSEIDVACEACHGPASLHVEWAESGAGPSSGYGFSSGLGGEVEASWTMNPQTGIAVRVPPASGDTQIEVCSGCHSRRSLISEETDQTRFMDRHMPVLLEEGLYYSDGQIQDEVYVYGSFVQSRMYEAGVRCGDCHEPHSLELRESGDALCAQCHAPSVFAVPSHHRHNEGSVGARCVECHMPSRTYMVIDDRRDHSFRIPRPDLSVELGSPNACNGCHSDRSAAWAAGEIASWPGGVPGRPEHYGRALRAGRLGVAGAQQRLLTLATDSDSPAIARASAVSLLSRYPGAVLIDAIRSATADEEPLIRLASARAADSLPVDERIGLIGRLLLDSVRAVRIEAARTLAAADPGRLGSRLTRARATALVEYRRSQQINAERPHSHVNLALLALSMGQLVEAEQHYRQAIEVGPYFVPAYVNLADLLRRQQREEEGEQILRRGLSLESDSGELHHAMGLLFVRLGRTRDALGSLQRANELMPESARYAYVFGVALYSGGDVELALDTLRAAHQRHPTDRDILEGLASICQETGLVEESIGYLRQLEEFARAARGEMRSSSKERG